ncbi:Trafficking Protein Particle Complex Subunit 9 [Manis pentadactyla]|nr:Trafficking Protein Particle Complex Subunit 9 [Manis pentadactyla]
MKKKNKTSYAHTTQKDPKSNRIPVHNIPFHDYKHVLLNPSTDLWPESPPSQWISNLPHCNYGNESHSIPKNGNDPVTLNLALTLGPVPSPKFGITVLPIILNLNLALAPHIRDQPKSVHNPILPVHLTEHNPLTLALAILPKKDIISPNVCHAAP